MHLILTGATGLIGSATLDAMLKMQEISKVSILSRGPVAMTEQAKDPRFKVKIHKDFNNYPPEVLRQLEGASGAIWALGISQKLVSAEVYITITKDYALAGAKAFADLAARNKPFRFIYVSGIGTTVNPGRFTQTFTRVKGETEFLLDELRATIPKLAIESVRPSGVDSTDHPAIKPFIPSVFLAQKGRVFVVQGWLKGCQARAGHPGESMEHVDGGSAGQGD